MAKTISREQVDFTGCGDYISQKRQDIKGQTSKVLLAERADSRLYHREKRADERQQRNRADQEFQHGGRSHVSA